MFVVFIIIVLIIVVVGQQIFLLCYCISSLSLISIDSTVAAVDFAIVLLMIVGIILFVGGTCFLVRFMSPLKLGIVIGTSLILANQMFVLSIITGQDLATRIISKIERTCMIA